MSKTASISDFYKDRCVLITGATGFLGKLLIEKLLRSCPSIGNIYITIRSKKEKDVNSRLNELLQSKVYDKLKSENPQALSKIKALNGDITKPDFNLDIGNIQVLCENVSVVFHCAASLAFVEPLKKAVENNLLPVDYILKLCRQMKSLMAIVHVSTAYCNCTRNIVEEIVYPPDTPPKTIINMINNLDTALINKLTPILLGNYPNTYVYTKNLAETLIAEEYGDLPISIVRPSIVGSSIKEPYEGWIDNFNHSPTYIMITGRGISRNFIYSPNTVTDFVPVDMCINLMIAVAREKALNSSNEVKVYHSATSDLNPLKIDVYVRHTLNEFDKHPLCKMVRAPIYITNHTEMFTFNLYMVWEYITVIKPYDTFQKLLRRKDRLKHHFMRYWCIAEVTRYFNLGDWIFKSDNVLDVWDTLTAKDKETFNFDVRQIKWPEYLEKSVLGCKLYLLKEDLSSLSQEKRVYNRLYWIHYIAKFAKWITMIGLFAVWKLPLLNTELVYSYLKTISSFAHRKS